MKDLFIVTKFTMKDMLQRKSFIITTIIFLIMIVIGFNIPNFMKIDSGNVFEGTLESLKDLDAGYEIQILNEDYEKIKEKIENEEIDSAIIVEKQDENIKIRYIVKSATMMSGVPEDIISTLNTLYTNIQINKLGLTEEQQSEKFYYNLFHELAHILYHHLGKPDGTTEDDEKQADEYAKNMLQKFVLLH